MDREVFHKFHEFVSQSDAFALWEMTKSLLLSSKHKHVPTKLVCNHSKSYWNSNLTVLSNKLREARKNFKGRSNFRNGEILKTAEDEFTGAHLTKPKTIILKNRLRN